MEVADNVNKKLKDMGVSNVSGNIKNHLYKIEEIISAKDAAASDLSCKLQSCDYDIKSIAVQTGLARSTFYKYDILQKYILYSKDKSRENNPYMEINELKQIIQEQKDMINLLKQRDCNMMLLEEKIQKQEKIIQEQNDAIERIKKLKIAKFTK